MLTNFYTTKTEIVTSSWKNHSHKKRHSLEMWAVKLRFLLIYENMLKSIATNCRECAAKHENKANHNTDCIVSDLTDFFSHD